MCISKPCATMHRCMGEPTVACLLLTADAAMRRWLPNARRPLNICMKNVQSFIAAFGFLQILRSGPLLMGIISANSAGTNCSTVAATIEQIATWCKYQMHCVMITLRYRALKSVRAVNEWVMQKRRKQQQRRQEKKHHNR
jgi:hypothetical protein